jgi:predicted PolB exonuclease-like 3'-5' exonuclease
MSMKNAITLDLETIPSQEAWVRGYVEDTIKPPWTLKKQESIEKWMLEEREGAIDEAVDKMGFDGSSNHIISFGLAIGDDPAVSFDSATVDQERDNLIAAFKYVEEKTEAFGRTFVGHNIANFDMKIIRQRAIVLRVPLPQNWPFFAKPWDLNPYDTMVQWDAKNFIKIDRLARAFGLEGKKGFDGSMVYDAWKRGEIERIGEYCRDDVELTRAVYKRMTGKD